MKQKFNTIFLLIIAQTIAANFLFGQSAPPGIPYQAIARNTDGTPYVNANLMVRFSLHEQTATGTVSYAESHSLQTNDLGLFSTTFGSGTPITGTFAGINWAQTTKFLQVEINLGSTWVDMGTQQLMSVPYSMYSGTASTLASTSQTANGNGCYSCPTQISTMSANTMDYSSAFQYCSNLNENGKTDWRVPTLAEFEYARDVLNLPVPIVDCWTKDFDLGGSTQQFIYRYSISSLRNIGYNFNIIVQWNTMCIR
jgi:hypothetical protein